MTLFNPYVWLGIALACLMSFFGGCSKGQSMAEVEQLKADQRAAAIAQAKEDALHKVIWETSYAAAETRKFRELETARTIACLRDGTCRMRDRFTCPRLPGTPQAAAGSDDPAAFGLQSQDGEFLVRESSRADGVADQLRQCQTVVQAYFEATQPQR